MKRNYIPDSLIFFTHHCSHSSQNKQEKKLELKIFKNISTKLKTLIKLTCVKKVRTVLLGYAGGLQRAADAAAARAAHAEDGEIGLTPPAHSLLHTQVLTHPIT